MSLAKRWLPPKIPGHPLDSRMARKRSYINISCAHCGEERSIRKDQPTPKYCKKCAPIYRDPAHYDCHRKHGLSRKPMPYGQAEKAGKPKIYAAYCDARRRCMPDPSSRWYRWYRNVEFRFESFEQWYEELGDPPSPNHTVDRINNLGHYEPGNVRWADWKTQAENRRPRTSCCREGDRSGSPHGSRRC